MCVVLRDNEMAMLWDVPNVSHFFLSECGCTVPGLTCLTDLVMDMESWMPHHTWHQQMVGGVEVVIS